jgi:7-carboxy-7-deazaguanine synthase
MLHLVEKFISISGEAPTAGEPILIIRFSRCNLNCAYCDTPYNSEVNEELSVTELTAYIAANLRAYPHLKVMFTGGEPLLEGKDQVICQIAGAFPQTDFYIETNGTVKLPATAPKNTHFVLDYKSPSSGYPMSFDSANFEMLRPSEDCIKIVVGKTDLDWVLGIINKIKNINENIVIYLSPVSNDLPFAELCAFILDNKLPVNLSLQLHKIIWGDKKGV